MAQPPDTLVLGPTETPAIRCKTCKVPLPDATKKNCARCRRNRTESHQRWKRSVEARKVHEKKNLISLPRSEAQPSSAPPSNVNIRWTEPAITPEARYHLGSGTTPAHLPGAVTSTSAAPLDHNLNERHHHKHQPPSPQPLSDAPGLVSSLPRRINQYQWGEELVDALLGLPPRSNFLGQFSIIADPDVDNSKRAQMFLDQLRSKGLPTSYVAVASFGFSFVEPHSSLPFHPGREIQRPVSGNPDAVRGHAIGLYCKCEIGCQGRFVVSADDDTTHLHGVPGQRVGVALFHTSG